ncbi:FecR family protein [Mucilaginibacter phyllosphaerae]|uniref:DUF4974 domain-containing protein n=1 Tax=Mucilaginibacter phyllosphaerae TaxID=1812349 RepID=A0A4Y8AK41_9SPHI|nr:FecR family protein [Mucilaginibacter phyllosphaerae]MBB3967541.1 ferric-dicitrate binding protein FerR (iron transport regulator) [Mucilaginibacter phyllosphaerae]TEW69400.1 DUF4974 domain-containing protein [Mucilaginibacter phyllosphaerae]GGH21308.1 anti-sigma factor [Mucilaginibacter phyllosphaerae]
MHNDKWEILIEKYLQGKCTPEEAALVEQYYNSMERSLPEFYHGDADKISQSAGRSLQVIQNNIALARQQANTKTTRSLYKRLATPMRIAATLLIFITAAVMLYRQLNAPQKIVYKQITAGTGHTLQIILADSSVVLLNAGSTLKYPENASAATRDVYLNGEGFFDVKHDAARPFIVHTNKLTTTVLGTAFSVSSYPNADDNTVTVVRGKVQVAHEKTVLGLITPGKQISYNTTTGHSRLYSVNADALTAWTTGKLQFTDQSLTDITRRLTRWYGYRFIFANSKLTTCRYTASFNNKIQLNQLLGILTTLGNIKYNINDHNKTVTLSGNACNQ